MKVNKETESGLIAQLQKCQALVSIPELQEGMGLSYTDAKSLVAYAQSRGWVADKPCGIDYTLLTSDYGRKSLSKFNCKLLCGKLTGDERRVLYYIGKHHCVTFSEILEDVDSDEEDMLRATRRLLESKIIIKHENHYYYNISKNAIKKIKKAEDSCERESERRHRHFFDDL